jgi:hypothetical protein
MVRTAMDDELLSSIEAFKQGLNRELWRRGDLSSFLRPHGQRQAYEFIHQWNRTRPDEMGPLVLNCHRRMGKSYLLVLLAIERCLRFENQIVRYGSPTFVQTQEIVEPLIRQILQTCPDDLKPEKKAHSLMFENGSQLILIGCAESADNHRGKKSHVVILDECADIDNAKYIVESVFSWHFAGLERPLFVLSSTPPRIVDHPFRTMAEEALRENRYLKITTSENADWSERDDRMLSAITHGKETTAWKREAECEFVTDAEILIVPEFAHVRNQVVVANHPWPTHFYPLASADVGYVDFFACLFGYVDFLEQKLIVEDEVVTKRKNTGEIVELIRAKEKALYGSHPSDIRRIADATPREIADLTQVYHLPFQAAERHDRESQLAVMRHNLAQGKIVIQERCRNLILQLGSGVRDKNGKFERSETLGHCDAVAALVYMNRMASWHSNPYPRSGFHIGGHFFPEEENGPRELEVLGEKVYDLS